ncbi:MAG: helix-turn-helix transcriptional regulator [Anaerolineales bacterium]|nr:helix-turn-helix transcriptional regulator [Anaerolineales bacterium]
MITPKEPNVGQTIRTLRNQQGFSLRDLSKRCGLSINAISKIERGENSPTVSSLHQLASALGLHIADFFRQQTNQYAVFVKASESTILRSDGITIESLGSGLPNQQLEPFKMIVAPHSGNVSEPVAHSGEEFIYCLAGRLEYFIGEEVFVLEPGDKLLFKATQPHSWCNLTNEPAEVILVFETNRNQPLPHKIH